MTAKILATLGALGLIATIWTADFRFLWTGLLLLIISVGIAAHKDKKMKDTNEQGCETCLSQGWQDGHDTALIHGQSENPYEENK